MNCQHCGATLEPGSRFCPSCGRPQTTEGAEGSPPGIPSNYQPPSPQPGFVPPTGIQVHTGRWIGAGWEIVKSDLGTFILMSLVFIILNSLVPLILQGPLMAGFHIVCAKKLLDGRFEFADLFKGFNFFVPALVACLIITVFTFVGSIFCIIPGLVLAAIYQFTYLFIIDKKMDFWPALQASHEIVKNDYFGFTLFFIVAVLLNIIGVLCCAVGVLATLPIFFAATTAAYKEIIGFEPNVNFG
jgi:uncharacterized membrane protein